MLIFDVLWWIGLAWFAAWAALPLALAAVLGVVPALVLWPLLAPWTALLGMAGVHRLLPPSEPGRFHLPHDAGSVRWALKGWAPALYLTAFQPLYFTSEGFARLALRAFGARIGTGARVTSRTVIREPHHVRVGARSLVGEFAHLAPSYQLRPGLLDVADIDIGEEVLVGAHCVLSPGVRIGARAVLEHAVTIGGHTAVGDDARIGEGTVIYTYARIGNGARIGKRCMIASGASVPDGAIVPDRSSVAAPPRGARGVA